MCIVALSWQLFENTPLLLLSNRDEYMQRQSLPLHLWQDTPIYAGRDLQQGGTWLGITAAGRWAVITNYREITSQQYHTSRGDLIKDYLTSDLSPLKYARYIETIQNQYAGFNLILGDLQQAVYLSNRGEQPQVLSNGVYILSNTTISNHWHKDAYLRKRFTQELLPLVQQYQHHDLIKNIEDCAFHILQDQRQLDDSLLPNTGLDILLEKQLSSIFIQDKVYATRCSNLLAFHQNHVYWNELTYPNNIKQSLIIPLNR